MIVEIKGTGQKVEFPDFMSQEEMLSVLRRQWPSTSYTNALNMTTQGSAEPVEQTLEDKIKQGVADFLFNQGIISDRYGAQRIGENIAMGAGALPVIGDLLGGDELGRALRDGDAAGVGLGALAAVPVVGDAARGFSTMNFKDRVDFAKRQLTNERLASIIEKAEDDGFVDFGIRVVTKDPITGKQESYRPGDYLPESFAWEDGAVTDSSIGGTSTVGIDWSGSKIRDLDDKIKILEQYLPIGDEIVIVGGKSGNSFGGEDFGELVIPDAIVLDVIK